MTILKKINKTIITLVEVIKNVNLLNLTFIFSIILSFYKINKYISFIIIMSISVIFNKKIEEVIKKNLGENNSKLKNKFYTIIAIILNLVVVTLYFLQKEYGMIIVLFMFYVVCILLEKIKKGNTIN